MQAASLTGQEVVVNGLGQQRVAEGVGVAVRDEHLVVDGLAQGGVELRTVEPDDLGEHLVGGRPARASNGTDDETCVLGETVDPHEHELGEAPGEGALRETGVEQLLGVEGVAGGTPDDGGRTLVAEPGGLTRAQDRADGTVVERLELETADTREP